MTTARWRLLCLVLAVFFALTTFAEAVIGHWGHAARDVLLVLLLLWGRDLEIDAR